VRNNQPIVARTGVNLRLKDGLESQNRDSQGKIENMLDCYSTAWSESPTAVEITAGGCISPNSILAVFLDQENGCVFLDETRIRPQTAKPLGPVTIKSTLIQSTLASTPLLLQVGNLHKSSFKLVVGRSSVVSNCPTQSWMKGFEFIQ
jgi:hypothetical protein